MGSQSAFFREQHALANRNGSDRLGANPFWKMTVGEFGLPFFPFCLNYLPDLPGSSAALIRNGSGFVFLAVFV
jgi:hypothetical protein